MALPDIMTYLTLPHHAMYCLCLTLRHLTLCCLTSHTMYCLTLSYNTLPCSFFFLPVCMLLTSPLFTSPYLSYPSYALTYNLTPYSFSSHLNLTYYTTHFLTLYHHTSPINKLSILPYITFPYPILSYLMLHHHKAICH